MVNLHYDSFAPCLNQPFTVGIAGNPTVELQLIEIENKSNSRLESFSLIFSGSQEHVLNQKTYDFNHHRLGHFQLFITPIMSQAENSVHYQAIVNRFKPTTL
ncbi:MAG: hypothetical protein KBA26_06470 [Candidatus Delongbacteria bacterium]|nr:hypothetical protein [Candidatus Delongbacteria bacterium]